MRRARSYDLKPDREVAILLTLIELKAMLRVLAVTARFEREEDEEDAYQSHFTTSEEFDQAARRKKKTLTESTDLFSGMILTQPQVCN